MWPLTRTPLVPVLRLTGPIGMVTPLRPGLSIATLADPLKKAFEMSKTPSVAIIVNSPGGSPVQSALILRRIRQLAKENKKTVHVFCEDVAASGGYYIALAGDEIFAEPSSIIGSIGVITSGFGLDKAITRLGVDRRIYTAGRSKAILDPFLPEKPEDVARLAELQHDAHDVFIATVKERRSGKLKNTDDELFSGAFWSGTRALAMGLIDGLGDVRTHMQSLYGDDVRLKVVPLERGGFLSRLRRFPQMGPVSPIHTVAGLPRAIADDLLSSVETRALWARYGL